MNSEERRQLWQNIPQEMRQRQQWCVCGPEYDRGSPKRPFNPLTRRAASIADPDSWVTFEQAAQSGATNIGFVFTVNDPFFVVDLDTYNSQVPENHERLLEAVETYAERSQSGAGAHVIGIGTVGQGRRCSVHAMEIYDHDRFIIMTGDRINDFGIGAYQALANDVLAALKPIPGAEALEHSLSQPSDEKDEDLISRIERAQNGSKFCALFSGNVFLDNRNDSEGHLCARPDALHYPSQSEADLALIQILCFFSPDDDQVARVFLTSALGQREKARRRDYIPRSIRSARVMIASNALPPLDFSALLKNARPRARASSKPATRTCTQSDLILTRVSDVPSQEVSWLWPGRIAEGKVTVVAGSPGLGKSQLAADAAARTTTGRAWPNDDGTAPLGSVLMLSCEDDIADTIRPRLEAAGADVDRVHVLEGVRMPKGGQRIFSLKDDIKRLEDALDRIPDVKLIVIDPITAYMNGADTHNTGDVRSLLAPLQDLAMRRGIAVLVVSHLNKGGGNGASVNAVTGSIAFVAAARAAFLLAKDREDPKRRLFLEIKNNLSHAAGLAFYVREKLLPNGIRAPYLEFQPGTVDVTADDAVSQGGASGRTTSALDEAKVFIIKQLRDGPVPATDMKERAEEHGIARKTLRKAQEELFISSQKETGQNGVWIWSLPLHGMKSNMPYDAPPE